MVELSGGCASRARISIRASKIMMMSQTSLALLLCLALCPAGAKSNGKWAAVGMWRGTHKNSAQTDVLGLGVVIGMCTAELIAPSWAITAGHCATRLLKHEKVTVRITFAQSATKVERGVVRCVKANGYDVDVAICRLKTAVHAFTPFTLNSDKYTTSHHGKPVITVGTSGGYHASAPKALEYEGNGAHLYVSKKSGGGMKAGDSGGAWVHMRRNPATKKMQPLLSGVIHGGSGKGKHKRGIAAQVSFIRKFLDENIKGLKWASASASGLHAPTALPRNGVVVFRNCYDAHCNSTFATAHLDTSLPCSGGCYKDKSNRTFCDSASNFRCLPDRIEYTQHVGVDDCSAGALLTVNTSVHTACTQSKNHEGVIFNQLVNYTGSC